MYIRTTPYNISIFYLLFIIFFEYPLSATSKVTPYTSSDTGIYNTYFRNIFISHGWDFYIGNTYSEIIQSLGKPLKESVTYDDNLHNEKYKNHSLEYTGLKLKFSENETTKNTMLYHIEISSKIWPLKYGLCIGNTRDAVIKILGTDFTTINKESIHYSTESDDVVLIFKDSILIKVIWSLYTG